MISYKLKIRAMLLGIYVLLLTAVPCHCHDFLLHETTVHTEVTASPTACDSNETEMCTPFCCCTAVHGVNFFFADTFSHPVITPHEKPMTVYAASVGNAFHAKLCHPPMA